MLRTRVPDGGVRSSHGSGSILPPDVVVVKLVRCPPFPTKPRGKGGGEITVPLIRARRWGMRSLLILIISPLVPGTALPGRAKETSIASPQGKPIVAAIVPSEALKRPSLDPRARMGYRQGYKPRLTHPVQSCDLIVRFDHHRNRKERDHGFAALFITPFTCHVDPLTNQGREVSGARFAPLVSI